jgi:peroxiredoxin
LDEAMRDSINDVKDFANVAYEAYVIKEIKENIKTPLGYLFLVQSVGIVSSAKLHPMFDKVPVEFRDKLYDVMKRRVETEVSDAAIYDKYHDEMLKSLEATSVGKIFQNFELNNINGGRVLLSDEVFANKYTLVFFWSGWLEDIKEQVTALSKVYDTYRNKGLQIVGVSLDGNVDDCKALADELDIRWVQLCNPSGGSAEVAAAYGITELPAAILVNKRGTILARLSNVSEIIKKIEELF